MALTLFIGALLAIQGVTSSLVENTWDLVEEGEVPPYGLLLKNEIIGEGDSVHALGATFTGVSELAWPRPASGCGHAKIINANVDLRRGKLRSGQMNNAIDSYAVVLVQAIENLRILGLNSNLPRPWPTLDNSCGDYGRVYKFEENFDAAGSQVCGGVRCAARRLYLANAARANQLAAAAGSAATDPALHIIGSIQPTLKKYLREVTKGGPCHFSSTNRNLKSLGGQLKREIFRAAESAKHKFGCGC